MKRNTFATLAVAGAATLLSAAAFAHGGYGPGAGCAGGTPQPAAMAHSERAGEALAVKKESLKLQPAQQSAWNAYEARVLAAAAARSSMHAAMPAGDSEAMADFRVTMMKFNAQAAEDINTARKALAAVLTAEQRASLAAARGEPGPMAGVPGHGGRHGMGMGMGMGTGPGTGAGRGCPMT